MTAFRRPFQCTRTGVFHRTCHEIYQKRGLSMAPDRLRKRWGFAGFASAPLTLILAVPALAQGSATANMGGIVPVAIAVGAGGFALVAVTLLRQLLRDGKLAQL